MKIIIPITCGFGPQGGWRVLSKLADNWILQGHEVFFLVPKFSDLPYYPTIATILWYTNQGTLTSTNDSTYKKPFLRFFATAYAMIKALNNQKADVVLATISLSVLPIYLSTIKTKKAYYVQAYEPLYFVGYSPLKIIYRLLSKVSYYLRIPIIVNSEFYFNYKGIVSNKCVYPGIDFSIFFPAEKKIVDKNKTITIGTIGRIEKYKGTYYILEAFNTIKSIPGINIELHIAFGDDDLNNINGVKVHQFKGDRKLSEFYKSLDIYICAGTYQLGAVHYPVIESMACGVPVVTTGYYPSNSDNSWLVPVKNSDAIVEQVLHIIENQEAAKKKTDLALIDSKQFDWQLVSERMIAYFKII